MIPLRIIRSFYPSLTWHIPTDQKILYLTFDDGPIPEITPWVLDQLETYNARATFFCVGENVRKHPDQFRVITEKGHSTGNHTYHHLKGWKTENQQYFSDIEAADELIKSELFRPPYGKLTTSQIFHLKKKYRIIMWDVLSRDYNQALSVEECFKKITRNARPGSIIVFHDSLKAASRLQYALPKVLEKYAAEGYRFDKISTELLRSNLFK